MWYDYFCVPQRIIASGSRVSRSRSLSENDFEDQRDAIGSIPAYINKCDSTFYAKILKVSFFRFFGWIFGLKSLCEGFFLVVEAGFKAFRSFLR